MFYDIITRKPVFIVFLIFIYQKCYYISGFLLHFLKGGGLYEQKTTC